MKGNGGQPGRPVMEDTLTFATDQVKAAGSGKKEDQFLVVFLRHFRSCKIDLNGDLAVVGGSWQGCGASARNRIPDVTLSNSTLALKDMRGQVCETR